MTVKFQVSCLTICSLCRALFFSKFFFPLSYAGLSCCWRQLIAEMLSVWVDTLYWKNQLTSHTLLLSFHDEAHFQKQKSKNNVFVHLFVHFIIQKSFIVIFLKFPIDFILLSIWWNTALKLASERRCKMVWIMVKIIKIMTKNIALLNPLLTFCRFQLLAVVTFVLKSPFSIKKAKIYKRHLAF